MKEEKVRQVQGWLIFKNLIPIEKFRYIDNEVIDIEYAQTQDMIRDIQKLLNAGIRFNIGPGIKEGYFIEINFSDMDWDEIMGRN